MLKRLFLLVVALFFSVNLVACGTDVEDVEEKDTGESTEQNTTEEKTDEDNQEAKDKIYSVGDTVKVDGLNITFTKASFTEPNEYSEATNGKVLTIEVSTENTTDGEVFIDNTDFSIYDAEGNKLDDYYGYDEMAISDNINSGKKLQGKLYYDVPEQESYEIIYTPTFSLDDTEIVFNVKP